MNRTHKVKNYFIFYKLIIGAELEESKSLFRSAVDFFRTIFVKIIFSKKNVFGKSNYRFLKKKIYLISRFICLIFSRNSFKSHITKEQVSIYFLI